jgi:formylglycine-generating enzyme required for sulfatase activity
MIINSKKTYVNCVKYSEIVKDIIDTTKLPYSDYFTNKKYNNYPVVGISQNQAAYYCMWKTMLELTKLKKDSNLTIHDYRLPSDAEWAYAASQPSNNKKAEGTNKNVINPSKSGNINDFGLYNLAGNVSEWTASNQQNKWNKTDTIKVNKGLRIVRGGSWRTHSNVDERKVIDLNTKEDYIGFRIVRTYLGSAK